MTVRAWAPGRVNLIGDHTDHTGGLVLPMAIDLGTTVVGERAVEVVSLTSTAEARPARVPVSVSDPTAVEPAWARYVAGILAELRPAVGFVGSVQTTLPVGAGLSSSAALEVAVALALGFEGPSLELARLAQRAEHRATGVPCGIMDQLASVAGVAGCAMRIDCTTLDVERVPIPDDIEVVVIDSGQRRQLATSAYAERAASCRAAESALGPLPRASLDDLDQLDDDTTRRRARHVITENARVDAFSAALVAGDHEGLHELMAASHASLRDDFEVSTTVLDELVATLAATTGVIGARVTGAGFGGCVVALVERGAPVSLPDPHWRVRPSAGAGIS